MLEDSQQKNNLKSLMDANINFVSKSAAQKFISLSDSTLGVGAQWPRSLRVWMERTRIKAY